MKGKKGGKGRRGRKEIKEEWRKIWKKTEGINR